MLHDNLIQLRRMNKLTQEALAEKVGVSRQTVSKWETGESIPDIQQSKLLADIFNVTLDTLVDYEAADSRFPIPPRGKHVFGLVRVGERGQIVIPAKARTVFDIKPGDSLLMLGDEGQGIAIVKAGDFLNLINQLGHGRDDE